MKNTFRLIGFHFLYPSGHDKVDEFDDLGSHATEVQAIAAITSEMLHEYESVLVVSQWERD